MFVLRFWAAILEFCGHIEIIKIAYCSKIRYLSNEHFDILHDFVSPVMFVLRFLAAIFVFLPLI